MIPSLTRIVTAERDGSISFPSLPLTAVGTYHMSVSELSDEEDEGHSDNVYEFDVTVTQDGRRLVATTSNVTGSLTFEGNDIADPDPGEDPKPATPSEDPKPTTPSEDPKPTTPSGDPRPSTDPAPKTDAAPAASTPASQASANESKKAEKALPQTGDASVSPALAMAGLAVLVVAISIRCR